MNDESIQSKWLCNAKNKQLTTCVFIKSSSGFSSDDNINCFPIILSFDFLRKLKLII